MWVGDKTAVLAWSQCHAPNPHGSSSSSDGFIIPNATSSLGRPIKWPPAAAARTAFALQTSARTYYFYCDIGTVDAWMGLLDDSGVAAEDLADAVLGTYEFVRSPSLGARSLGGAAGAEA